MQFICQFVSQKVKMKRNNQKIYVIKNSESQLTIHSKDKGREREAFSYIYFPQTYAIKLILSYSTK